MKQIFIFLLCFFLFVNVSKAVEQNSIEDSLIVSIISKVNVDSVRSTIQSLQNFQTRFLRAPNRFEIANWLVAKFQSYGISDVKLDTFVSTNTYQGTTSTVQMNVVATIPGTDFPDEIYIIGGHYDSFSSGNPLVSAPGADDNASGTAAALETARVIMVSGFQPKATIKFIAFAAEELMLYGDSGCEHYADTAFALGMNIKLMINCDMISYTSQPLQNSRVSINYYTGHTNLLTLAKEVTNQFTQITAVNGSLNQYSDSYPFYQKGYPAVYFEENNFSPYYHTVNDIISNYSMPYCAEVIKAAGATLLKFMFSNHPLPVELISFSAFNSNNNIVLNWSTASELNNYGFEIQRSVDNRQLTVGSQEWDVVGFVNGIGTTTEINNYSFVDYNITSGKYSYRLKQIDFNGNYQYSQEVEIEILPSEFILYQNYPNPFNPTTTIEYSIPQAADAYYASTTHVLLKVFDILGNEVSTLINEFKSPGKYEVQFNAADLPSGVYFYHLFAESFGTAGVYSSIKKLIVLK